MRETVHSYADLVYRVEAQIAAEEPINTHRRQFEFQSGKRKNPDDVASFQRKKFEPLRTADLPPRPPRRDQPEKTYTPLNTSRVNILMAIQDKETLRWPPTLKPNSGNQDLYCHFHKSRGHKTESCFQLKEEIERLVRQGYLGQFIQGRILPNDKEHQTAGQQAQKQQQENRQFVGEIAMIAGGPSFTQEISATVHDEPVAKKSRISYSITFDKSDFEGVQFPHQDPLIISAGIGDSDYLIRKNLVDGGSSVDVLFYRTFLSMGLSKESLLPVSATLLGFNKQAVDVEGSITLPVTLGVFPRQVTHAIKFMVVKLDSVYDAIFGRPFQIIFKAVASIPHLTMKFPTPSGTGTSWGVQKAARPRYLQQAQSHISETLNVESFDLWDENISQHSSPLSQLKPGTYKQKDIEGKMLPRT